MNAHTPHTLPLLVALTALTTAVIASAPEKRLLREGYSQGDRGEARHEVTATLRMRVTPPGKPPQTLFFKTIRREIYSEDVLATLPSRLVVAFRRQYLRNRTDEFDTTGAITTKSSPLEGRTVEARIENRRVVVKAQGGPALPEDAIREVQERVFQSEMSLAPNRLVAIGDSWTVNPKVVGRMLPGADRVAVKARFAGLVHYRGHPCAKLTVSIEARGRMAAMPVAVTLRLTGSSYHALDLDKPLSLEVSGPIHASGVVIDKGMKLPFTATGSVHGVSSTSWLKSSRK